MNTMAFQYNLLFVVFIGINQPEWTMFVYQLSVCTFFFLKTQMIEPVFCQQDGVHIFREEPPHLFIDHSPYLLYTFTFYFSGQVLSFNIDLYPVAKLNVIDVYHSSIFT